MNKLHTLNSLNFSFLLCKMFGNFRGFTSLIILHSAKGIRIQHSNPVVNTNPGHDDVEWIDCKMYLTIKV